VLENQLEPLPVTNKASTNENNPKEEKNEFPVEDAKQYAGTFYSEELDVTYYVTEKDNKLYCSIKNKKPFALRAKALDLFTFDSLEFRFVRDNKNQIAEFSVNAGRVTNLKFIRK